MLDVLLKEDIHNVAVVVTRYFGGTLLGTGGLVRAYSGAVQEGLRSSVILTRQSGVRLEIRTDYTDLGKIQYLMGQEQIPTLASDYTDSVYLEALVPVRQLESFCNALTEGTAGKVSLTKGDPCDYARMAANCFCLIRGSLYEDLFPPVPKSTPGSSDYCRPGALTLCLGTLEIPLLPA